MSLHYRFPNNNINKILASEFVEQLKYKRSIQSR